MIFYYPTESNITIFCFLQGGLTTINSVYYAFSALSKALMLADKFCVPVFKMA